MQRRRVLVVLGVVPLGAVAAPGPVEQARIERLIAAVGAREDLRFIRNGRAYAAADAAKFLREKLKARGSEVQTAQDFIDKIASRSSTTGHPYLIRQADGREQPAGAFLQDQLQRLER